MTESEFLGLAEATLEAIEAGVEQLGDEEGLDIEASRHGNVLELEITGGGKIIINSQAPLQEIWVAAKSGGFHYRRAGEQWIDTRSGMELFKALSEILSLQSGQPVQIVPRD